MVSHVMTIGLVGSVKINLKKESESTHVSVGGCAAASCIPAFCGACGSRYWRCEDNSTASTNRRRAEPPWPIFLYTPGRCQPASSSPVGTLILAQ
eukprot:scaffold707_cov399-Prasinococcus_capsulatus_cf.AAC.3